MASSPTYRLRICCSVLLGMGSIGAATFISVANAEPRVDVEYAEVSRELTRAKERVRSLTERLQQLELRRARDLQSARDVTRGNDCSPAFYVDLEGVKHLRTDCSPVQGPVSCETPFTIDQGGMKRLREACLPTSDELGAAKAGE